MRPDKILMCRPDFFEVNYTGNEFMKGNINNVDKNRAMQQWNQLKQVYENLNFKTEVIEPVEGLVDMVFTANQSLPFLDKNGIKKVILSKMRNDQRKKEVEYFKQYYELNGYETIILPDDIDYFESEGDSVIDYERNILFGGYGYRTQKKVYEYIANYVNFNIVTFNLINPILYHLDTCFSVLNSETVVIAESAFDAESLKLISGYFSKIIRADEEENLKYFVCNCHCPDVKNVIVQKGSVKFKEDIIKNGFNLIEVETGEFMKSGGSVFCMKLMLY